MKSLLNASSLSQGCVIGLKVNDPRKTFPPNSSKTKLTNIEEALQCLKNPDQWSSNTCESDLWEIHEKVENIKQLKTVNSKCSFNCIQCF